MNWDWTAVLLHWTPASVWLLVILLLITGALSWAIYFYRTAIVAWFFNRVRETSSAHAFYLAITATLLWLMDLGGLMPGEDHVPFALVKTGWGVALLLFIKRDKIGSAQVAPGPGAGNPAGNS